MPLQKRLGIAGALVGFVGAGLLLVASLGILIKLGQLQQELTLNGLTFGDFGLSKGLIYAMDILTIPIAVMIIIAGIFTIMEKKMMSYLLFGLAVFVFVGNLIPIYEGIYDYMSYFLTIEINLVQTLLNFGDGIILLAGGGLALASVLLDR